MNYDSWYHARAVICEHKIPVEDPKTIDYRRLWEQALTSDNRHDGIIVVPCNLPSNHGRIYWMGQKDA